ncbi:TPA: tetratricopeptide repeat protein [Candidatus Poribacteria bacterium]|nr:tetratricopeptide repeat protein [Candidatus Poribacteria bacterium]
MNKERQQPNSQQSLSPSVDIEDKLRQAISLYQSDQLQQAEQICQQILRSYPQHAEAFHLLGIIAYQVGENKVAIGLITQAIEIDSNKYMFFNSLGSALQGQGRLEESIQAFNQALKIQPQFAEAHYNKGNTLQVQGKLEEAIDAYQQAIHIQPDDAEAYSNLGNALQEQGRLEESIQAYQQAIHLQPNHAEAYSNLGIVLKEQGRLEESIQAYHQAIHIQPNHLKAYYNLGNALREQERLEESIQAYHQAIHIQPNHPEAYSNLGVALQEQGKLEESIQTYHQAIHIQPNHPEAYSNLGVALQEQGRLEESIQAYHQAIHLQPNHAEAYSNLGIILLLKGNLLQGWKEYEWRWKCADFNSENRNFPQLSWNGTDLNDKSILIWAEQGIGDEIMFTSILPTLSQMTERIIIECNIRLVPLFQRSFPQIQSFSRQNPPNLQLLNPDIDYQIPMGSLGQWLRTDEDSFEESKQPYLTACANRSAKIRKRYQILADGKLLVGISWKSTGINQRRALLKSTILEDWTSILSQQECYFINLQYGDVKEELEQFHLQTDLMIYQDEEIDSLQNLDDFAAQVSALDLVISIDNMTVHMAGALGKKVWTLLPYIPDWRWMLDREDTPWYPSMRLFRQSETGDWSRVFAQVRSELEQYMEHSTAE